MAAVLPMRDDSVPAAFARQAAQSPARIAIQTGSQTLSYATVNTLANDVTHRVHEWADDERRPVATLIELGALNIAALLGVMKTGAAVVPLDPHWPVATLRYCLEHCGARVLVASPAQATLAQSLADTVALLGLRCIVLSERLTGLRDDDSKIVIHADDPAVILYTSGSTGLPKGVIDNHRNLLHEVMRITEGLALSAEDRQSMLRANCAGAISDACSALLNGATLLPYDVVSGGLPAMGEWLAKLRPTVWRSAPSLFRSVFGSGLQMEQAASLRLLFLCGEPATGADLALFQQVGRRGASLVNCFGATETATVTLQFFDHRSSVPDGLLPTGHAVKDMEVLLEDAAGQLLSCSGEGEVLVRSWFLASGYLGDADRTARALTVDAHNAGLRIYRTGDMGKVGEDGALTVLGRRQWHVESRGGGINTTSIESTLLSIPCIREVAVVFNAGASGDRLDVYFAAQADSVDPMEAVRSALMRHVDLANLPILVTLLDQLPKTANGKINRHALHEVQAERLTSIGGHQTRTDADRPAFIAPRTPLEQTIADLWRAILGLDAVGVHDHFFNLGGQSVQAMQVVSRLVSRLGFDIPLRVLFERPILAEFAAHLSELRVQGYSVSELEQLLTTVERMTEAEVEAALDATRLNEGSKQT